MDDAKWDISGVIKGTRGRAAVCVNVDEFKDAIGMAGSLPLHIKFLFGFAERPEEWKGILSSLVKEVFRSPITPRIFDLYFDPSGLTPELVWDESLCKDAQFFPLSNLQVLCVSPPYRPGPWMDSLLKWISQSSRTSLRSFTIRTLVKVQKEAQIDSLITGFVNLEELNSAEHDWPATGVPPITLHHLTSLNVRCPTIYFGRLNLPQLRSLIIVDTPLKRPREEKFDHLSLPNLRALTINTRTTEWLEHIAAPELRVLSITGVGLPSARNPHPNRLSPNLFTAVEEFTLVLNHESFAEDLGSQDLVLIWALGAVPNAISVYLHVHSLVYYDGNFRMALIDRLASMKEAEVLCPRLRNLHIKYRRGGPLRFVLRDDEHYYLRRVMEVRRKMGRELNSFVVQGVAGEHAAIHRYYVS
jgi:hypothetical protein